jgi:hypothetical protein
MQQLNNIQGQTQNQNEQLNNMLNNTTQDNNLQMVLFNKGQVKLDELNNLNLSSYEENFSWLTDDNGKIIDFNRKVNLFNGVSLISNFLEKKYGLNKSDISDKKLSEFISIFSNNKDVTILDLFNHVGQLYKQDKNSFCNIVAQLTTESDEASLNKENTKAITENFLNTWNSNRPLGQLGETTLNEVAVGLKNLKWDVIFDKTQISLNAVPVACNAIGYSLILKSYLKHVYNRPYQSNLSENLLNKEQLLRRRHLALFSLVGAPLILFSIRESGLAFKDMFSINLLESSETQTVTSKSNDGFSTNNSGLFLIIKELKNKLPKWLKLSFSFLFISFILINKFGLINILNITFDSYYLKVFILSYSFLVIIYLLLNLYFVYLFSIKKIQISEVLPNFVINWLKDIEVMCSSKEGIQAIKELFYRELLVYIIIIAVVIIL